MKTVFILMQVIGLFCSSVQICQYLRRSYDDGGFRAIGDNTPKYYGSKYETYYEKVSCDSVSEDEAISSYRFDHSFSLFEVQNRNIGVLTFASMAKTISKFYGIKLNNNCINSIEDNAFANLTDLREINLEQNNISSLQDGLFAENTMLKAVDLSYNSISVIGNWTFHSPLHLLSLDHNKLRKLNFQLPATLEYLDLSSNFITQIPKTFFKGMIALEDLSLENNSITTLPTGCFQDLNKLNFLSLANNKIHRFPKHGTFSGLYNIRTLNFANNSLEDISGLVTHSLESLYTLNIENNQIHVFDTQDVKSILRTLSEISINGNSFNCSSLRKILTGFAEKNVVVSTGHEYSKENIKGIACDEDKEEIKIESVEEEKEEEKQEQIWREKTVLEQAQDTENKESDVSEMTLSDHKKNFANFQNVTTSNMNAVLALVTLSLMLSFATLVVVIVSIWKVYVQFNRNVLEAGLVETNNL